METFLVFFSFIFVTAIQLQVNDSNTEYIGSIKKKYNIPGQFTKQLVIPDNFSSK